MTGIILSFREKVEKIVLRCWYFKNAFHFALMKLLHYSFMSPFSTAFRIIQNCFMYFVCVEESKSMNEKNLQKVIFRILFKHQIEINMIHFSYFDKLFSPWMMILFEMNLNKLFQNYEKYACYSNIYICSEKYNH